MSTYLTKSERGFLMWELAETLESLNHTPSEIRRIIGDVHELQNTIFYRTMVDWMPDCMDALRYYNERLQATQKS